MCADSVGVGEWVGVGVDVRVYGSGQRSLEQAMDS